MSDLDEALVKKQRTIDVRLVMITYNMFLEELKTYSEITNKQRHQIAGEMTHAVTVKSCLDINTQDVTYYLEKILNKLE